MTYCPKCGSTNINEIISKGECTDRGLAQGFKELDAYPIRPCIEFECEDCKARWDNLKYQEYLLHRAVRKIT